MEVILKWCSKSVFIYHKVTQKTKARFLFSFDSLQFILLQATLNLILTIQFPFFVLKLLFSQDTKFSQHSWQNLIYLVRQKYLPKLTILPIKGHGSQWNFVTGVILSFSDTDCSKTGKFLLCQFSKIVLVFPTNVILFLPKWFSISAFFPFKDALP